MPTALSDIQALLAEAGEPLEKANANLEPELLSLDEAQDLLAAYAKVKRLASYGEAALGRRVDDARAVARATGTTVGKAKETVATGKALRDAHQLDQAMRSGELSLDQAAPIAKTVKDDPEAEGTLVHTALTESVHVLNEQARQVRLEAQDRDTLAQRQHAARRARIRRDDLGMVEITATLEPHVGEPLAQRLDAQAKRLSRRSDDDEPFSAHLADAFVELLSGQGKAAPNVEMTILVSHQVTQRGWTHVDEGEHCEIPGLGPISPKTAQELADDAFLNGVFFDGTDLRHFKRFGRHKPPELKAALNLGPPPGFDGRRCTECGNRFGLEHDHLDPVANGGETSLANLNDKCWPCHRAKTEQDREAGLLGNRAPPGTG